MPSNGANKNGLTPKEHAVLAYLLESRHFTPTDVSRFPTGMVDKFREPLQNFVTAIDDFRQADNEVMTWVSDIHKMKRDGIIDAEGGGNKPDPTLDSLREARYQQRQKLIDAFGPLQAALLDMPAIKKRAAPAGKNDNLIEAMMPFERSAVDHEMFRAMDAAERSSQVR